MRALSTPNSRFRHLISFVSKQLVTITRVTHLKSGACELVCSDTWALDFPSQRICTRDEVEVNVIVIAMTLAATNLAV